MRLFRFRLFWTIIQVAALAWIGAMLFGSQLVQQAVWIEKIGFYGMLYLFICMFVAAGQLQVRHNPKGIVWGLSVTLLPLLALSLTYARFVLGI